MKKRKSLAIIGIGRWGRKLLHKFSKIARVSFYYHRGNAENSKWLKQNYPKVKSASSYSELLRNNQIDAVVIATPIKIHYELAKRALLAGKDVFVEKPLAATVSQARELVKLAEKKRRILFVGHIFSYHPALAKIKQIIHKELLKYAGFIWNKWGTFNEELLPNLGCHDIATALDLFGDPIKIETLENRGVVTSSSDVVFIRLSFKNRKSCTIYLNRVSNFKNKTTTLVTNKNIYLWESDQLFKLNKKDSVLSLIYKSMKTPLEIECAEFIKCLKTRKKPLTDGRFGLKVVEVLSKI